MPLIMTLRHIFVADAIPMLDEQTDDPVNPIDRASGRKSAASGPPSRTGDAAPRGCIGDITAASTYRPRADVTSAAQRSLVDGATEFRSIT